MSLFGVGLQAIHIPAFPRKRGRAFVLRIEPPYCRRLDPSGRQSLTRLYGCLPDSKKICVVL